MRFCILTVLCFLCSYTGGFSQNLEIGGLIGSAHYFGDLNPDFSFNRPGLSVTAFSRYNFDRHLSGRASISYANVGFSDSYSTNSFQKARNLNFYSDILDVNLRLEFNFFPLWHGSDDNWAPFLTAGLGVFSFDPKTTYQGKAYSLSNLGTEGQRKNFSYGTTQLYVSYGGGVKYDFTPSVSLNFEVAARLLFTDYLDDVSGNYPNIGDVLETRGAVSAALADRSGEIPGATPIGIEGRQRGDSKTTDSYIMIQIGLSYNFNELRCPTFHK